MKKLSLITAMILIALAGGCTSQTQYGACVGLGERQNPKLHYKVSGWNVAMSIIFVEMIIPPIIVISDETFCPVGPEISQTL